MRNNIALLLCAMAILWFAACDKPLPPLNDTVEAVPEVDDPLRKYIELDTADSFEYFSTHFTAEVGQNSVDGTLRIARDSVIWISASKMIELFRAKMTPDSLFAVVRVANRYLACGIDELCSSLGADIDFATVQNVLLGKGSRKNLLLVEYDNFDTIDGEEFPRQLEITLNDRRFYNTATIRYNKIVLNQPAGYPWSRPKNGINMWPLTIDN